MCGRAYITYSEEELSLKYLNKKKPKIPKFNSNYNLSPTQLAPIVLNEEGAVKIELLKWGLVPFWAKDIKIGFKMINARSETVDEKPAFRAAFKKRRCVIPLSGFIEWKRDEDQPKRPFKIHLKEESILSAAGLWEEWTSEKDEILRTFTILTTDANSFMEKIHDRMPVLLTDEQINEWLDEKSEPRALKKLFKPSPSSWLKAEEISTLINSPKNNSPEVLKEIS